MSDTVKNLPPEATQPGTISALIPKDAPAHDKPDHEREALTRMREKWELPDLLVGGTPAFRAAKQKVLVQEQDETEDEYARRMSRTVLTNYYANTIDTHSGMPFGQNVAFDPPLPEPLKYLESDADGEGRSITVLARDLLREAMHRGLTHLMVDLPPSRGDATHADTLRRRPKLLHIQPGSLLGVVDQPGSDGEDVVRYARIAQTRTKKVGRFGEATEQVVLEINTESSVSLTWEQTKEGAWVSTEKVTYTPKAIPLFTLYAKQVGPYEGDPAYQYLAELNRAHFQSDADQRHALSFGRRATLARTGWREATNPAEALAKGQKPKKKAALGYARSLDSENEGAKAYLVETSGAPLAAGENDLKGLEQRMERFGAQQISQAGGITATSRELDNARDTCNLQAWCTRLENVIMHALRAAAELKGVTLPASQRVKIDRSFSSQGPSEDDLPHIFEARRQGLLPKAETLSELIIRGVVTTIDDVDEAISRVEEEGEHAIASQMERLAQQVLRERQKPPEPGGDDADPGAPEANVA